MDWTKCDIMVPCLLSSPQNPRPPRAAQHFNIIDTSQKYQDTVEIEVQKDFFGNMVVYWTEIMHIVEHAIYLKDSEGKAASFVKDANDKTRDPLTIVIHKPPPGPDVSPLNLGSRIEPERTLSASTRIRKSLYRALFRAKSVPMSSEMTGSRHPQTRITTSQSTDNQPWGLKGDSDEATHSRLAKLSPPVQDDYQSTSISEFSSKDPSDSSDVISVSQPPRRNRSTSNSTLSSFVLLSVQSHLTSGDQGHRQSTTSSNDFSVRSLPDSSAGPLNPAPTAVPALSALSDASHLSLELEDLSLYTDTHDTYRYMAPHPPEIQYSFPSTLMAARYFPSNMPSRVARTIFALLDRQTLHSTLTVSKGWFRYAVRFLYRDPFDSERIHAQYCGPLDSLVSPSPHSLAFSSSSSSSTSSRQSLRPPDERKLVRLLLRSIGCPSEPGEKEVLVCEENEWIMGRSKLVDEYGQQIQTSVNYIRFLEVFDWAPWQRYIDFWDSTQLMLEDEEEDKRAAAAALVQSEQEGNPSDDDNDDDNNIRGSDSNGSSTSSNEEQDDYYKQAFFLKRKKAWRRARRQKRKEQRR
ncbi:hypothetical protein EC968_005451, partial [Mortierella alpina]